MISQQLISDKNGFTKSGRTLLFFLVLLSFAFVAGIRFFMLQKSPEPNGLDGYFYALQAKSLMETGHLENPGFQCGYYLCGICSVICRNPIAGVKIWSAFSSAGISLAIFLLIYSLTGKIILSILGFFLAAASPTITLMGINYINNQTGVLFLILYAASLSKVSKIFSCKSYALSSKISFCTITFCLLILSILSHKLTLVFSIFLTLVFLLPIFFRILKKYRALNFLVWTFGILILLAGGFFALKFFRLHSPRFANAFSFPTLPIFSRKSKGSSLALDAVEMSVYAPLLYLAAICVLIKKCPCRHLLILVPALYFPFWNLESDMGQRLWMTAVPLGIPLCLFFLHTIFWGRDYRVKPDNDMVADNGMKSDNDMKFDDDMKSDDDMVSGRWGRLGMSALAFLLLIATIFTPHVYDPKTDPPYAYYKKVVRDIDLQKDSLLIAHLGLNHVYTYEKDLKDCLNWLPNFDVAKEKLWRLSYGVSERRIREVLESCNEIPVTARDLIRGIDSNYVLLREDLWQEYLSHEESDIADALCNWYNPHEVRPDYIRKIKRKR